MLGKPARLTSSGDHAPRTSIRESDAVRAGDCCRRRFKWSGRWGGGEDKRCALYTPPPSGGEKKRRFVWGGEGAGPVWGVGGDVKEIGDDGGCCLNKKGFSGGAGKGRGRSKAVAELRVLTRHTHTHSPSESPPRRRAPLSTWRKKGRKKGKTSLWYFLIRTWWRVARCAVLQIEALRRGPKRAKRTSRREKKIGLGGKRRLARRPSSVAFLKNTSALNSLRRTRSRHAPHTTNHSTLVHHLS